MATITFDDALDINIPEFNKQSEPNIECGLTPANYYIWSALLTDIAVSLYTWDSDKLPFYDRLLIEKFIHQKTEFCLVKPQFIVNNAKITKNYRIMECVPTKHGSRNTVIEVRLVCSNPPKNMVLSGYKSNQFVFFNNFSETSPSLLVTKYATLLGRLDALYDQNLDKLGVPIIAICDKTVKNDLINTFKRTKVNALFSLINEKRNKATELFYDAKIEFILDKVNLQRDAIMREFLQEMGVSPNDATADSTQYVNVPAVRESSLISKYFSATINKYRSDFRDKVNVMWPDIDLSYRATIKTYETFMEEVSSNAGVNQ